MTCVHSSNYGTTAVLTLDSPPVNSLGFEVRVALLDALDSANGDSGTRAIVITGSDKVFSGGADIREFGSPRGTAEPNLATIIDVVESSQKPVIAAISGVCMGGALELALAAHFRIARPDALIALPEVKIGLLPGAGGTQRLPRLVGIEAATNFIVGGEPLQAEKFIGSALFDEFIAGDFLDGVLAFAAKVTAEGRSIRRTRDKSIEPHPNQEAYFQYARTMAKRTAGRFAAPLRCIDAIQAAVVSSFEEGLQVERNLFLGLLLSAESRALRHTFLGERAAGKMANAGNDLQPRTVEKVGVVGAGMMGAGIAMNFLNAGIPVVLLDTGPEAVDRGIAKIRDTYEAGILKGKLGHQAMAERMALLAGSSSFSDVADCDLVIEAVFEDMAVKQAVFQKLDDVAKQGAILATNTSTLDIDKLARFTKRPQDVLGMHFFSPANIMRLLEVVRGAATAPDVLITVLRLAKKIRKTAVVSGVCDGFIGNRLLDKYIQSANSLIVAGATPWQVDAALEKWGMAMGPFRMADLAGNDIGWAIRKRRQVGRPTEIPDVADRLCERARFGQKVGKGWYRYEPGSRRAIPDPAVEEMIVDFRRDVGSTARRIEDEEIIGRCIYALVNEGARALEDGIAARASDIDVIFLTGYGFPAHRGGPMLYADEVGLFKVARTMKAFAASGNEFWEPAALICRRLEAGASLTDNFSRSAP